jgi:hypothetical protein
MSTTNINLYYNDSIKPFGAYYAMDTVYEKSPIVCPSEESNGKTSSPQKETTLGMLKGKFDLQNK